MTYQVSRHARQRGQERDIPQADQRIAAQRGTIVNETHTEIKKVWRNVVVIVSLINPGKIVTAWRLKPCDSLLQQAA
jgi:hypothetical protein